MKPGPVAEHLGRPPSRVPLCSDSGPLWSREAGLKVELPLFPAPAPIPGSRGPSCAWVASVQILGWQSEVGHPGNQLDWRSDEGSCQKGLLKLSVWSLNCTEAASSTGDWSP